jgi:hypothetical protein
MCFFMIVRKICVDHQKMLTSYLHEIQVLRPKLSVSNPLLFRRRARDGILNRLIERSNLHSAQLLQECAQLLQACLLRLTYAHPLHRRSRFCRRKCLRSPTDLPKPAPPVWCGVTQPPQRSWREGTDSVLPQHIQLAGAIAVVGVVVVAVVVVLAAVEIVVVVVVEMVAVAAAIVLCPTFPSSVPKGAVVAW